MMNPNPVDKGDHQPVDHLCLLGLGGAEALSAYQHKLTPGFKTATTSLGY